MSLKNSYPIGISLPKEVIKKIDAERLDIPRSRYILRLIENVYKKEEKKNVTTGTDIFNPYERIENEIKELSNKLDKICSINRKEEEVRLQ